MFVTTILPRIGVGHADYRKTVLFIPFSENCTPCDRLGEDSGLNRPIRKLPPCSTEVPSLERKRDGHWVACHLRS
jgi:hypothetical protein